MKVLIAYMRRRELGELKMKALSGVMLTLLVIISLLTLASNIQPVKAEPGTIYIRADGSVEPSTAPIQRVGDLYTFTDNIYDPIVVERSNITIDGKGYTLQGSGSGNGFYWYNINNMTVKNTNIKDFGRGVYLKSSNNSAVYGNTITNNTYGVHLSESSNNTLSGNNITNSTGYGVYIGSSNNSAVYGNTITNSTYNGVALFESFNNTIFGNTITNSTVHGVSFVSSSNITISGNTIKRSQDGVYIGSSNNSAVYGNTITNSTYYGVILFESFNNTIYGNTITNSSQNGVVINSSSNNTVYGNTITNNTSGIELSESSNITISGNTITNNTVGISLYGVSSNNKIYHNNFIDNQEQAGVSSRSLDNVWDDGYPSGGNYWSDYTGVDLKSGPSQDQPGSDGIGDTAYVIDANNQDHYPLTYPYSLPLEVTATASPTTISSGQTSKIKVTATSDGNYISGVTINLTSDMGGSFSAVTDHANGTYTATFTAPAVGTSTACTITVTATKAGYTSAQGQTTVTVIPILTVSVTASPATIYSGGTSTIRVSVTSAGTPISGATVSLTSGQGGTFSAITDHANSTYTATFTAPDIIAQITCTINASVSKSGYTDGSGQTQVTVQPLVLNILVKDAGGNPLAGATVVSTSQPSGQTALNGTTDANGLATFTGILKGSYTIKASKSGYEDNTWTGTVAAGQVTTQTITLATPFQWTYVIAGIVTAVILVGAVAALRMRKTKA